MKQHHRMIKLQKLSFLFVVLTFLSCGPSSEEQAEKKLAEVKALKEAGNFNLAKLKIDTLLSEFGALQEKAEAAKQLLLEINISEQERNLAYLDSSLQAQEALLQPMLKNFIESDEYGSEKILIHRRQRPENSYNRTFLRAHLKPSGEFYISSRYHGTQWIHHKQIRVYYRNQEVSSLKIEEDDFNNRRFEDGEFKWEIVTYRDGKDNGVVDFIAKNYDQPLRVQFRGKKYEYIILERFDREAIRDAYEISFLLKEISQIKEEQARAKEAILQLKK